MDNKPKAYVPHCPRCGVKVYLRKRVINHHHRAGGAVCEASYKDWMEEKAKAVTNARAKI